MTREWMLFIGAAGLLAVCVLVLVLSAIRTDLDAPGDKWFPVVAASAAVGVIVLALTILAYLELADTLPSGKPATTAPHEGQGGKQ